MGSGGGGGSTGIVFKKPRRSKQPGRGKGGGGGAGGGGGGGGSGDDVCYLSFETDLAAVDPSVTITVEEGEVLSVGVIEQAGYPAVICRTSAGKRVGSLANVEDLAQLIACMRSEHEYQATIRRVGKTFCTVFVEHS